MIGRAQDKDRDERADLYARNHPGDQGRLTAEVHHESQMFVARDEADRLTGLALVSLFDCGVIPHGIIQQLEVAPELPVQTRPEVRDSLVQACVGWLEDRGVDLVYARTVDKGAEIKAMLRYARSRHWVFDPETGEANDAGPASAIEADPRSGPRQPQPVQAARHVWA